MSSAAPSFGHVAVGFERVRDVFDALLESGRDVGAGLCVFHQGRKVVDLVGGWRDTDRSQPYTPDTLQVLYSTSKGVVALAVAMCVERGLVDYDEPVAQVWPEFATAGKEHLTVGQLLAHEGGLYCLDAPVTFSEVLDWEAMTTRLARSERQATTGHGYHALTWGWLAGELVRRVDGRDITTFVAEEIATPLGGDCWFGLPERYESRVAPINTGWERRSTSAESSTSVGNADTLLSRVLTVNGALAVKGGFNRRDVREAVIPAANGVSNAATIAAMYSATFVDTETPRGNVRLLGDSVRERAATRVTPHGERDDVLRMETTFSMGFMTPSAVVPFDGEGSFGHPGAGGSLGFADPHRGVAFAYVMNRMGDMLIGDDRATSLTRAVYAAV
jgi:CubicO group peptidase (beta-lactamase class C family)